MPKINAHDLTTIEEDSPKPRTLTLEQLKSKNLFGFTVHRFEKAFGASTEVDDDQWPIKAGAALKSSDIGDLADTFLTNQEAQIFKKVTDTGHYPSDYMHPESDKHTRRRRARAGAFAALYIRSDRA